MFVHGSVIDSMFCYRDENSQTEIFGVGVGVGDGDGVDVGVGVTLQNLIATRSLFYPRLNIFSIL